MICWSRSGTKPHPTGDTFVVKVFIHDYAGHPFVVSLSRELAMRGHDVVHAFASGLLTPRGTLERREGDPEGLSFRELKMNANYRRDKYRFVKRRQYECAYGHEFAKAIAEEIPDVVISGNTPSEPQWSGVKQCREFGIPFVSWVQDFYSVAVRKLAAKKSAILGKIAGYYYSEIDRKCFKNSAHTIPISDDFIPILNGYGVPSERITTIENWGALGGIPLRPKANEWARKHGFERCKVLMYSGTLAMKHNPKPLVDLALRLKDQEDVRVVLISEGPGADYVMRRANEAGLRNLIVLPFQRFEDLPDVLGTAEIFLALLEPDAGIFSVPSKILSYLCAGKPTVAAMPKENLAAKILVQRSAGVVVSPEDSEGFVESAIKLLSSESETERMGMAGREYAETTFEIGAVTDRFEKVFNALCSEKMVTDQASGSQVQSNIA